MFDFEDIVDHNIIKCKWFGLKGKAKYSYVSEQVKSNENFKLYFFTCMHFRHHQLHAGVLVL